MAAILGRYIDATSRSYFFGDSGVALIPTPKSQRPNDAARLLRVAPRGTEFIGNFVQGVTLVRRDKPLRSGP
jgi:hypothetical protein